MDYLAGEIKIRVYNTDKAMITVDVPGIYDNSITTMLIELIYENGNWVIDKVPDNWWR